MLINSETNRWGSGRPGFPGVFYVQRCQERHSGFRPKELGLIGSDPERRSCGLLSGLPEATACDMLIISYKLHNILFFFKKKPPRPFI
jgi:hypothetical protein